MIYTSRETERSNLATMNLLKTEDIKLDYSSHLDRISITRNEEWISISVTCFEMLHLLSNTTCDYERIVIQQQGSEVEIIKLLSNFILTFKGKNLTTSLVLTSNVITTIKENFRQLLNIIRTERSRRPSAMKSSKRMKLKPTREGEQLFHNP